MPTTIDDARHDPLSPNAAAHDEASSAISLAQPPRPVPLPLRVGAMFSGRRTQIAWFALLICLAPIWYLTTDSGFSPVEAFAFLGPTTKVEGLVTELIEGDKDVYAPFARDGAGNEYYWERVEIKGLHYGYQGPDGTPLTGIATGLRQNRDEKIAEVGASVSVEYSDWNPEWSRVIGLEGVDEAGLWLTTLGFWAAIVVGLIALAYVLEALVRGMKTVGLLAGGLLTEGRLVGVEPILLDKQLLLRKLVYAFHDGGHEWRATVLSDAKDVELSDEPEPIFYDPSNPTRAVPVREMKVHLEATSDGRLTEGDTNPYNAMWLPALCFVGYAWFALAFFGLAEAPDLAGLFDSTWLADTAKP